MRSMVCERWRVHDGVYSTLCARWCVHDGLCMMVCARWCVHDVFEIVFSVYSVSPAYADVPLTLTLSLCSSPATMTFATTPGVPVGAPVAPAGPALAPAPAPVPGAAAPAAPTLPAAPTATLDIDAMLLSLDEF